MIHNWEQWEGRTVGGKFLLGRCLGGTGQSAAFQARSVEGEPANTVIKLVVVEGADADTQLRRWKTASELRHPNLIRILDMGRWAPDGQELLYMAEEYAEENLAQVVPERALTAEEARAVLVPVLSALEYVHGKGLAHGRIRPSDIMAAGDQIKLSSDNLRAAGEIPATVSAYDAPEVATKGYSPASDLWSLGITLVEVLTQRAPVRDAAEIRTSAPEVGEGVEEPFRTIARRCLEMDAGKRCGIREILDRLEPPKAVGEPIRIQEAITPAPITEARGGMTKWRYWLALGAVVVVAAFLIMRVRPGSTPTGETSAEKPTVAEGSPVESAPARAAPQAAPLRAPTKEAAARDEIVERVMPEVAPSARRTIHGKIRVRVRVTVDNYGHVADATLKDAGPSKYFARIALEAARRWKFAPAEDKDKDKSRAWTLLFAFTRERTETWAARAR